MIVFELIDLGCVLKLKEIAINLMNNVLEETFYVFQIFQKSI